MALGWAGLAGSGPHVMGILNVTPDSFSDGGRFVDPAHAVAAGHALAEAGAAIVDVGGESTRPGAAPVSADEEQARILPIIRALADAGILVSVDTRNAATMQAALGAGARIVNDVSGLAHDPAALGVVARAGCDVVLMHMRGTPETMAALNRYDDVAADVARELGERIVAAEAAGIARARIAVDPGIGFAKGREENIELLRHLDVLRQFGCPILVGVSRKSFLGRLAGETVPERRDPGSIAAGLFAVVHGASILRVHDVPSTAQALRVWQTLAGTA